MPDEMKASTAPVCAPVTRPVNTIGPGKGITQISAGGDLMLALVSDGTVLAWGGNGLGQLGIGSSTTQPAGPVQVTGLTGATQVAAGAEAGFAVHVPQPVPPVPDLTGDTTTQAGQVLQAAGLVLGAVTKVTDKYRDHLGTVISQNPAPGTTVFPGSAPVQETSSDWPRARRICGAVSGTYAAKAMATTRSPSARS